MKIILPETAWCGKFFGHKKWSGHLNRCEFCKLEKIRLSNIVQEKIPKAKRIFTEEHRRNMKNSWTEELREKKRQLWKNKNPMFSENIKDKIKKTNLIRYGTENVFQSELIKKKLKNTWNKNYGVDNPWKSSIIKEKIKTIINDKYGVDYPTQNKQIRDKIKETNLLKYGVENPRQNKEILERSIDTYTKRLSEGKYKSRGKWKTGYYLKNDGTEEWYDSSLELTRMKELDSLNLIWTKKHKIRIKYINKKNIQSFYIPDFLIENKIIEETKGWLSEDSKIKAKFAIEFCKQNNFQYRFLLNGKLIEELSYIII